MASLADRIAYTAHDLEDAARAGIVDLGMLPELVVERCGPTRSTQLRAFINDVVETTHRTGLVGMSGAMAEALSELRRFDYERIYLRPASAEQSRRVVELLRALVEHYAAHPAEMPSSLEEQMGDAEPGASVTEAAAATVAQAVAYVAGMTDRFACVQAIARLG